MRSSTCPKLCLALGTLVLSCCGRWGYEAAVHNPDGQSFDGGVGGEVNSSGGAGGGMSTDGSAEDGLPNDASGDGSGGGGTTSDRIAASRFIGTGSAGLVVSGLGFAPDILILHSQQSSPSVFAARSRPTLVRLLSDFNASGMPDVVTGFTDDGFVLGSKWVNTFGVATDYIALKASAGSVAVGEFVGDGKSRSVRGTGFQPSYVFVVCDGRHPVHRSAVLNKALRLTGVAASNAVVAFSEDGFDLGVDADVNQPGSTCQWFAVKAQAGLMATITYTGNKTTGRRLIGFGFMPRVVFAQCESTAFSEWVWRSDVSGKTGDLSYVLNEGTGEPNLITQMLPDGFEVGSETRVNGPGFPCSAVVFGQ